MPTYGVNYNPLFSATYFIRSRYTASQKHESTLLHTYVASWIEQQSAISFEKTKNKNCQ